MDSLLHYFHGKTAERGVGCGRFVTQGNYERTRLREDIAGAHLLHAGLCVHGDLRSTKLASCEHARSVNYLICGDLLVLLHHKDSLDGDRGSGEADTGGVEREAVDTGRINRAGNGGSETGGASDRKCLGVRFFGSDAERSHEERRGHEIAHIGKVELVAHTVLGIFKVWAHDLQHGGASVTIGRGHSEDVGIGVHPCAEAGFFEHGNGARVHDGGNAR